MVNEERGCTRLRDRGGVFSYASPSSCHLVSLSALLYPHPRLKCARKSGSKLVLVPRKRTMVENDAIRETSYTLGQRRTDSSRSGLSASRGTVDTPFSSLSFLIFFILNFVSFVLFSIYPPPVPNIRRVWLLRGDFSTVARETHWSRFPSP